MPKVDVIVLNYNGKDFLRSCLTSLCDQSFRDFQVLLVDNASTDDSVQIVRNEFPEVHILALPENLGFCKGNNQGIKAKCGKYIALLNNDTEVVPGWLKSLVDVLERQPQVGFCASRMIRFVDRETIDSAGDVFYTHGVGGKRGNGELADQYDQYDRVFGACAGAALYRRSMLENIGLFDEDFSAYDEDVDLSFRAQLCGYQCQYVPDAIAYHHVGGSFKKYEDYRSQLIGQARRNMLEVLLKNMPARLFLKHGFWIAAYYITGDLAYALRGQAWAVLRARWENWKRLKRTLAKRRSIQRNRRVSMRELEAILTPGGGRSLLRALQYHLD
jgi:hypothetical protein